MPWPVVPPSVATRRWPGSRRSIPGPTARAAADEPDRCYYRVDYPGLRLLCCDSSVPGRHDGELGPTQLAWLDRELRRGPDVPAVLAMHHHPVPSGIAFMDSIMLSDADDLAAVLRGHPPLARILTGHVHRPTAAMFAGCLVTSAPSANRQVFLDLGPIQRLALVDEPPGMLLHRLQGATAVTHLVPLSHSGPPLGASEVAGIAGPGWQLSGWSRV